MKKSISIRKNTPTYYDGFLLGAEGNLSSGAFLECMDANFKEIFDLQEGKDILEIDISLIAMIDVSLRKKLIRKGRYYLLTQDGFTSNQKFALQYYIRLCTYFSDYLSAHSLQLAEYLPMLQVKNDIYSVLQKYNLGADHLFPSRERLKKVLHGEILTYSSSR